MRYDAMEIHNYWMGASFIYFFPYFFLTCQGKTVSGVGVDRYTYCNRRITMNVSV
ncbi:hypothetical protein BDQ94DRAFT_139670 [Aspergillus welwitschiae]|uniref:Uncharacterized protein n=1 Tax=Aspergillus welwitschiae TaxID=1341132 RepID=A0A3F3Q9Q2_9EURO|nr:hypothetical protein BDQ94DRAFT_139670 [Aspergillus welwitschiae]RDH35476.1 hypothetical protein BDQ94DRAFT_139670 [Aspergillus welwitschiae]